MEFLGIQTTGKRPQNDVTYYICLKKKAETLGSMPLKFYQKSEGKIETAKKDDMAVLLTERPNPYMTPATFWSSVSANLDHYGNAYVWVQQDFTRQKYGGFRKGQGPVDHAIKPSQSACGRRRYLRDGRWAVLLMLKTATPGTAISLTRTPCCTLRISLHSMEYSAGLCIGAAAVHRRRPNCCTGIPKQAVQERYDWKGCAELYRRVKRWRKKKTDCAV